MNSLSMLSVVAFASAALTGCAGLGRDLRPPPPPVMAKPPPVNCGSKDGPKPVQVTVESFTATAVRISLPAEVLIKKQKDGLRWELNFPKSRKIAFTADGVFFKANQPGGIASSPATGDVKSFVWCFNETQSDLTWNYGIKIYDQEALINLQVWECDPTIRNSDSSVGVGLQYIDCIRSN